MSTASAASGIARKPVVLVLAIIAVLAIIVGVLWMLGIAPGFLDVGSRVKDSGHHLIRGAVAIIVGLGLGVFAFIQSKKS